MTTSFSKGPIDTRICIRCNRSHGDPGYFPVHDAQYENVPMRRPEPEPPAEMAMPFDPVLRQALLVRGVITLEDLTTAEQMIRATTGQLLGEVRDGTANG